MSEWVESEKMELSPEEISSRLDHFDLEVPRKV